MADIVDIENRSYELKLEGPVVKIGGSSDIPDINTIRNNAQLGANAYNTISTYGDVVTHDADDFATAVQGALADTALQAGDDVSKLVNDAGYISSADLSHYATKADLTAGLSDKQDRLVSGSNIKTINGIPLIGSGNITVGGTVASVNSKTGAVVLTASDVNALPDTTKYGYAIDLEFDEAEDHLTVTLKDQDGATLSSKYIDLALESVVVGGAYDSTGQKIVLTLKNGSTVDIPVGDLVDGLQAEITSTHKLNADLVDDSTSVNKFTTAAEKATWNGKQDAISDLATIRSGAAAGSTALQAGDNVSDLTNDAGYITSTDLSNYTTETYVDTELDKKQDKLVSGTTLKTVNNHSLLGSGNIDTEYTAGTGISITSRAISVDNTIAKKSEIPTNNNQLTNGAGYITGITSSDVVTALGYTPTNSSSLATVATSGDYDDLSNKPTIPTVNNATLTIQKNGTSVGTFTANASANSTVNITVPTNTNELTNGAGFITGISSSDVTTALGYTPADDSNVVKTSGDQTIAGAKTFNNVTVYKKNQYILVDATKGTNPDTGKDYSLTFNDTTNSPTWPNSRLGLLEYSLSQDGLSSIQMSAFRNTAGSTNNCSISCSIDANGNVATQAPTPDTSDNSTKIATTAYVKAQGYALDSDVVKTSGNQTVGGEKAFTSNIVRKMGTTVDGVDHYNTPLIVKDSNDTVTGYVRNVYHSDNSIATGIQTPRTINGAIKYASIEVGIKEDGTVFTSAPTPATSDNSDNIATTAFVKSVLSTSGGGLAEILKEENGYCKFSDGLIIQWGTESSFGKDSSVTYPTAFSSGTSYTVVVTPVSSTAFGYPTYIKSQTSTGFVGMRNDSQKPLTRWLAIGY